MELEDFYNNGDWFVMLEAATRRKGDPVTGKFYVLEDGEYRYGNFKSNLSEKCGDQIAIAFDSSTNQVIKHGRPEEVEKYAINARKEYSDRKDDVRYLVPTLFVVWMPKMFDADEINKVLRDPRYLLFLMRRYGNNSLVNEKVLGKRYSVVKL